MRKKVQLKSSEVLVELDGDHYGAPYWDKISTRQYEPDTIGFLENRCNDTTDFMDIGAANGAMTLIAASQGSRVSSYEPDPKIFRVVCQNFESNPDLKSLIFLHNKAISDESFILRFKRDDNASILSAIVFTGHNNSDAVEIQVCSLAEEIERFHSDKSRQLLIKMDIEGAEWRILKSKPTLSALRENSATLLLAVHPGFHRPFVPRLRGLDEIRLIGWKLQNYRESLEVFELLTHCACIYRTNLNPVVNKHQFAALITVGYHEFILDFSRI